MGDEVKSEVQEMNDMFESRSETAEPEPEEDSSDNEAEETEEQPDEEEEVKEEETVETVEEGAEEEEPEPEPETEDEPEEDEKDKIIAELRKKLDAKDAEEEPDSEPEPEPEQEPTFETQQFLDEDEDLDDLIREPGRLNEVFNKVYQQAVTDTRKTLGEGLLRSIPDIVRANVDIMDKLKQMNNKFYSDNKDLEPFKKVVAAVFEEVATASPGKDMMDLLPAVADESRKRLELHKKAVQTNDRKSPRLPRRKRRTALLEDKPNTNPLLNELEEMNKTIRR